MYRYFVSYVFEVYTGEDRSVAPLNFKNELIDLEKPILNIKDVGQLEERLFEAVHSGGHQVLKNSLILLSFSKIEG